MSGVVTAQTFRSATREHKALTAGVEKKLLIWIAKRMPSFINSDHLTVLGLLAQFCAGACYAFAGTYRWTVLLACFFIVLNWLGDSLDGTLARVRNQQRPRYGFYVDHVVDMLGSAALLAGLGLSGFIHMKVALALLIAFLLLCGESYLTTYTLGRFPMSQGYFGPTELRILLCIGNVRLFLDPTASLFGHTFFLFDIGGVIATIGMVVMMIKSSAQHTAELYKQETIR